ncbi:MAG: 30S ribosome-binding factor RbfA [Dehalococcoidia bacterium]|nr:30S ribosome-binding factor RbfA [Dehalococcoidia bacterium]
MSRRLQRLNVLFREELASLVGSELRDPRLSDVISITSVDVSPDLENAQIYVSVLGDEESKASTIRALTAAAPFLRRHLLVRIRIRRVPSLHFVLDESIEAAAHVLDLMRQVSEKEGQGDSGSRGEMVKEPEGVKGSGDQASEGQGVRDRP